MSVQYLKYMYGYKCYKSSLFLNTLFLAVSQHINSNCLSAHFSCCFQHIVSGCVSTHCFSAHCFLTVSQHIVYICFTTHFLFSTRCFLLFLTTLLLSVSQHIVSCRFRAHYFKKFLNTMQCSSWCLNTLFLTVYVCSELFWSEHLAEFAWYVNGSIPVSLRVCICLTFLLLVLANNLPMCRKIQ